MATGTGVIDRLRRPEYTGGNRCVPCTAVNLLIAAALALAIGFALPAGLGPPAGALVLLAALAAIYLRGYLVPGTPWFTKTYFPDWLLRAFEKEPDVGARAATGSGASAGVGARSADEVAGGAFDAEAVLLAAGAVEACADVDDLCLSPEFRAAWRAEIEAARGEDVEPGDLATALDPALDVERRGELLVALDDGRLAGQWESEAAFLADVAAAPALADRYPAWADLGIEERGAVLNGLRLFLERCPSCDGPVSMGEETVDSCCRWVEVVAVACEDCGARLFEAEVDEVDAVDEAT